MTRIAYLDCFSGVSGDMLLGALVHAGASLEEIRAELARVPLTGYTLEAKPVTKAGIAAVQAEVRVRERQEPRVLTDVTALIDGSSLPAAATCRTGRTCCGSGWAKPLDRLRARPRGRWCLSRRTSTT